jgi:uncharacterized membrane protein YedE/YeeE
MVAALATTLAVSAGSLGWKQPVLLFIGMLFGVTLYHASFGFASAYRSFFVKGDVRGILAQVILLAIATIFFAPLILAGFGRGAVSPIALQAIFGATLFGVGMQLGSGCACGTLYAIGGGSSSMVFTLISFSAGSFFASLTPIPWRYLPRLAPFSLVETWGWYGAALQLILLVGIGFSLWFWKRDHLKTSFKFIPHLSFKTLLRGPWSPTTGAFALALLSAVTLIIAGRPWGVTWGFTLWAAKLARILGWDPSASSLWQQERFATALNADLLTDTTSLMNFGIVLGAAAAAAAAGSLTLRYPQSVKVVLAALLGGFSMGYGAWLSFGCNVGAYFSGIASTSLHGWLWIFFALLGTALGVWLRPLFALPN